MSIKLLTDSNGILSACRHVATASGGASIAVAFFGRGAISELGLDRCAPKTRLIVNADSGCCHPEELRQLLGLSALSVRNNPRLHAKSYVSATRLVVGSANASANGLGFTGGEARTWREACLETDDARSIKDAKAWFEERWTESEILDDDVLKRAHAAWERARRNARLIAATDAQNGRNPITMSLDGSRVFVEVTDEDTDLEKKDVEAAAETSGISLPPGYGFYHDWASIPKEALLFAFGVDKDGSNLFTDGDWLTGSEIIPLKVGRSGTAQLVFKASKKHRHQFGTELSARALSPLVKDVIQLLLARRSLRKTFRSAHGSQFTRPTAWCVPLESFLEFCRSHGINTERIAPLRVE